eukprot:scaffold2678_cov271-Chaetoceros_neogracile.AAC.2
MSTSPSVDRINWMLAKMIDINGIVLVVSKEDASSGAMGKGNQLLQRRSASGLLRDNNYKKRKRSEVSTQIVCPHPLALIGSIGCWRR